MEDIVEYVDLLLSVVAEINYEEDNLDEIDEEYARVVELVDERNYDDKYCYVEFVEL